MADRVSAKQRSKIMASVGTRDTGPELFLRKALYHLGYRYRTHYRKLPCKPDMAFPRLQKAIFVHGCFWHGHRCNWGRLPKSRLEYWEPKIAANRSRDRCSSRAIRRIGWDVLVIWQCELREIERILPRIRTFLGKVEKKRLERRVRIESG
jgi:DNA mismatch endonuclease (patch repair protein)